MVVMDQNDIKRTERDLGLRSLEVWLVDIALFLLETSHPNFDVDPLPSRCQTNGRPTKADPTTSVAVQLSGTNNNAQILRLKRQDSSTKDVLLSRAPKN